VNSADGWESTLRAAGFRRIAKLTGKSNRQHRERVVEAWRQGKVDIVVGTSAFGLGIDYPHGRSVIHACVPETLDRFYQEVGRGGRDGKASISLIVPAAQDFASAERLNRQKVIGVERGLKRWGAMFSSKVRLDSGRFAVRIDARPGSGEDDIDMFGDANSDWNLRTLALLARAGALRLLGAPYPKPTQPGEWLEIDLLTDEHLGRNYWDEVVEPVRRQVWLANERNLTLMRAFLDDDQCPANIFEELYGPNRVNRACSRCRQCRTDPAVRQRTATAREPRAPWQPVLTPLVERLLGADGRLLVTFPPQGLDRRGVRRLGRSFERLSESGVFKLLLLGDPPFEMDRVLEFAARSPFFVSQVPALAYSRLPFGPEIVMASDQARLDAANLAPQAKTPRIFILPEDYPAPDGRRLKDTFGGRMLDLDEFHARVSQ
jgi:hypothetical protein